MAFRAALSRRWFCLLETAFFAELIKSRRRKNCGLILILDFNLRYGFSMLRGREKRLEALLRSDSSTANSLKDSVCANRVAMSR